MQRVAQLVFQTNLREFESLRRYQLLGRMLSVTTFVTRRHVRILVALSMWVVAQLAEHRTVTAAREGSIPFDPPKTLPIPITDCRLHDVNRQPQIVNRAIANRTFLGTVAER